MATEPNANAPEETSAETPVDQKAAPDNRTAEEKAATSHLANVSIPTAEEGEDVKDKGEEVKLPKTLKATLDLIAEGNAYQPTSAADAKRKAAAMEKLRAHAHALSQGTPAPVIYGKNHVEMVNTSSAHAEEIHLTFVCRTDRIVADRLQRDAATIKDLTAKLADAEAKLAAKK
jgi:hypothetical protein